jgi:signal peptidase I
VNPATKSNGWKGLLASAILAGTGQFLSGARCRGVIWFVIIWVGPFLLLVLYNLPFVSAKAAMVLLGVGVIVWLAMLYDSYRPIRPLRWWGWILLVVLSLTLSQISSRLEHRLFHAYRVPTQAMAPTISAGDDVLICRAAYWFHEPNRGDLIVFNTSGIPSIPQDQSGKGLLFIKRLVGLPNDIVEIGAGSIWVNRTKMKFGDPTNPIEYRHVQNETLAHGGNLYAVPAGEYFVLGDNSANSYDSRYWGTIRRHAIYGKVKKIYWPWNRMSTPR